jgi:uncharacterized oligopeptide transporter (OPT) family protein
MTPREPELTVRAVATGTVLGAVLSLCNLYSGLKIGWGFNMSITAALLGWGFWSIVTLGRPNARFSKLENNLNQTGASAGASISSAGLVSAIPAWTMMTGQTLSLPVLAFWLFAISMVGANDCLRPSPMNSPCRFTLRWLSCLSSALLQSM